jgi:hypothetical protein
MKLEEFKEPVKRKYTKKEKEKTSEVKNDGETLKKVVVKKSKKIEVEKDTINECIKSLKILKIDDNSISNNSISNNSISNNSIFDNIMIKKSQNEDEDEDEYIQKIQFINNSVKPSSIIKIDDFNSNEIINIYLYYVTEVISKTVTKRVIYTTANNPIESSMNHYIVCPVVEPPCYSKNIIKDISIKLKENVILNIKEFNQEKCQYSYKTFIEYEERSIMKKRKRAEFEYDYCQLRLFNQENRTNNYIFYHNGNYILFNH